MMSQSARIGISVEPVEAFWVQVNEAIYRRCSALSITPIPFSTDSFPLNPSPDEENALLEEIFSQELDVIMGWSFPESLAYAVLNAGVAIVHLSETSIRHPLSVSPTGLQRAAELITQHLAQRLPGEANILVIGGLKQTDRPDDGRSRISGIEKILKSYPALHYQHLPTHWDPPRATVQIRQALESRQMPVDAIIGLSDTLALIGRDTAFDLGLCTDATQVVGINGDPAALTEIINGTMLATIETPAADFGERAFDIAMSIVNGQSFPEHFEYKSRLITAENATEVATNTLIAISSFPNLLAGYNHQSHREHLTYLETSLRISHEIGTIHDEQQLIVELSNLIRANYGYDVVQIALWSESQQTLRVLSPNVNQQVAVLSILDAGILGEAFTRNELIFIPDLHRSFRFEPDSNWPATHTRVVVPIRQGATKVGLLDLHAFRVMHCSHQHLVGLQSLADQLGVALQNLKLYQEILQAKAIAEKAEQLKTRLMANVSHELRNPLQIILGYAEQLAEITTSAEVAGQIYANARHLLRLINDLLDLSRAEINELRIVPQLIDPKSLLEETFRSLSPPDDDESSVEWQLKLPEYLPLIQVDPDRFRQILLNLLSNAQKFTSSGTITLGADVASAYLHVWVRDTGDGISPAQQEHIFEPFATANEQTRRKEGIGLGLSITRRLVALHSGALTVDSHLGRGTTFHFYLPLPNLKDAVPALMPIQDTQPALFLLSSDPPRAQISRYCRHEHLEIQQVCSPEELEKALKDGVPRAIAWNIDNPSQGIRQVVQRIYAHPVLSEIPFLLFGSDQQDNKDAQVGDTNFLLKPIKPRNLLGLITSMYTSDATGAILIVDDDLHARQFYAGVIAEHLPRYAVQVATDGRQAITRMEQAVPDLVILDLMMPEMDGFEVIQWMRAHETTQHVPVVVLSGKMLTIEDIKRLESFRKLTFQTKRILSEDELARAFQDVLVNGNLPSPETSAIVKRAVAYIQNHYEDSLTRGEIAQAIGVSENYLTQVFHDEMGIGLWEYVIRFRIVQSKNLLLQTDLSIAQVATRVGFDDPAYFSRVFRRQTGQSPRAFRKSP